MMYFAVIAMLWLLVGWITGQDPSQSMLSSCRDNKYHKEEPGPEGQLFNQCTPWKTRSCCTYNTTLNAHHFNLYNFNYNHCGHRRNMSDQCRRHFIQDLCFYECSPNVGPWVVKVQMKVRKERFYEVPLCRSDCDIWFAACSEDYTCTDNWARNFVWDNNVNECLIGTECLTFKEVYGTAERFCERVWDGAWKVINNSEPCMRLWFDGSQSNPNDNVAKFYVEQMLQLQSSVPLSSTSSSLVLILSVYLLS